MWDGNSPGSVTRVEEVAGVLRRIAAGLGGLAEDPGLRWRSRGAAALRQRLEEEAAAVHRLAVRVDETAGRLRVVAGDPLPGLVSRLWDSARGIRW